MNNFTLIVLHILLINANACVMIFNFFDVVYMKLICRNIWYNLNIPIQLYS